LSGPLRHRAPARRAPPAPVPPIQRDHDLLQSFLSDAAHVPGGVAAGVVFPTDVNEVAAVIAACARVLPVGAQSSLTGGATPRGDVVLSTRRLTEIGEPRDGTIRVGAGVPLSQLQGVLGDRGLYYPPAPTFEGAFTGGTVATNAAGAATFKYGTTRRWVDGLTIVLADGSILELQRGDVRASDGGQFEFERGTGEITIVQIPTYTMPAVSKLSAGYYAAPGMDLVDLFVGSEGTLGVIVDATLRVIPRPAICVALIQCDSELQAIDVTGALRSRAMAAWRGEGALDVAAIEYIDARSVALLDDPVFARAGLARPPGGSTLLIVQIELGAQHDTALLMLQELLNAGHVDSDPVLALPGDDRGATRLIELRESVPASVNAMVAAAKAAVHPDIQKTAGDLIVPFERLGQSLALYRDALERRGLDYAVWGHASDGNLHPNVIPKSLEDVEKGRDAIREMARGVTAMGGAPLAEHGVGRSTLKQSLLVALYGERGIEEMRAVKRALDPEGKLAAGVLFSSG
jgi:D-lactate dehydrogenase (cytochrome)